VTKTIFLKTPCLESKPPDPYLIPVLSRCPEGLELCLDKENTWILNNYMDDLIHWAHSAYDRCSITEDEPQ